MHAAARDYITTYSHPRYSILLLSTSVQFYIITPLYVQCILQLCVLLLLFMLYVDCTRDKSEVTSIKTYICNTIKKQYIELLIHNNGVGSRNDKIIDGHHVV